MVIGLLLNCGYHSGWHENIVKSKWTTWDCHVKQDRWNHVLQSEIPNGKRARAEITRYKALWLNYTAWKLLQKDRTAGIMTSPRHKPEIACVVKPSTLRYWVVRCCSVWFLSVLTVLINIYSTTRCDKLLWCSWFTQVHLWCGPWYEYDLKENDELVGSLIVPASKK